MAGLINELMDIMGGMANVISELTELSRSKKEIVINDQTSALKQITAQENTLVGRYQKLERTAEAHIKDISTVLNTRGKKLTLGMLGDIIKEQDDYPAYMEVYKRLKTGIEELKTLNDQNRVLINNALEYIDYSVNVIRSTFNGGDNMLLDTKN